MSVQALMLAVVVLNNRQYSYLQLLLLWGLSDRVSGHMVSRFIITLASLKYIEIHIDTAVQNIWTCLG